MLVLELVSETGILKLYSFFYERMIQMTTSNFSFIFVIIACVILLYSTDFQKLVALQEMCSFQTIF